MKYICTLVLKKYFWKTLVLDFIIALAISSVGSEHTLLYEEVQLQAPMDDNSLRCNFCCSTMFCLPTRSLFIPCTSLVGFTLKTLVAHRPRVVLPLFFFSWTTDSTVANWRHLLRAAAAPAAELQIVFINIHEKVLGKLTKGHKVARITFHL